MTEGRAITMALEAVAGRENPLKVQQVVKSLLKVHPTDTLEDALVFEAMKKIVGEPLGEPEAPGTDDAFENLAWAWQSWAIGKDVLYHLTSYDLDASTDQLGVLKGLALASWGKAIENLLRQDQAEAKRHYKRAMDVGGQFGLEINQPILWTYAASFFDPRFRI